MDKDSNFPATIESLSLCSKRMLEGDILPFWATNSRDIKTGGFFGNLDNDCKGDEAAPRSVVMTSRHLWTFSAASRSVHHEKYAQVADYAYQALISNFYDADFGGFFWLVGANGSVEVGKKQIYGQAFCIYALAEYSAFLLQFSRKSPFDEGPLDVLQRALSLFTLLETHARDPVFGGYIEACARDWGSTKDFKLSEHDIDCDKSMNTNLHVMESLTTLHRVVSLVAPSFCHQVKEIGSSLTDLCHILTEKILKSDNHLGLYFNADWSCLKTTVSFGHDIEASWLIWEAAEELGNEELIEKMKPFVLSIADTCLREGFDADWGCLLNERSDSHVDKKRIWWVQAEALVGFFNAWEISGEARFLEAVFGLCSWIEEYQRDKKYGEWFWAIHENSLPDLQEPKGGNWKTGYHSGRCCMEIYQRVMRRTICL